MPLRRDSVNDPARRVRPNRSDCLLWTVGGTDRPL